MTNEQNYEKYIEQCKRNRVYPLAYDIWMERKDSFRFGQKMEIGYDLNTDHTGKQPGNGSRWTTSEGEGLSNYCE